MRVAAAIWRVGARLVRRDGLPIILAFCLGCTAWAARGETAPGLADSSYPPEPLSPWTALDADIEHLVARGELPIEALSFRPVDRGDLAAWVKRDSFASPSRQRIAGALQWEMQHWLGSGASEIFEAAKPSPGLPARPRGALLQFANGEDLLHIAPYLRFAPTFESGRKPQWSDSSRLGFRAVFYAGRSLVISSGFHAAVIEGRERFADPLIADTDLILHADEVTLSARLGVLRLRLGRDRHHWGPGVSGSLLLSEQAEPFDFVEYQLRLGERFRFLALTGMTDRAASFSSGANPGTHRYLAAHRLLWNLRSNLSLSLSEAARYQDDTPGVLYLSGILPYTLVERLDQQDDASDSTRTHRRNNVLWSVDVTWQPLAGVMLYGEVLADDIATRTSATPTRGGYQLGCTYAPRGLGVDWTIGAEYTRVSNYTYSVYYQADCLCDWEHQGRSIGYTYGPDVEVLLLRGSACPSMRWRGKLWLEWVRKGSGSIGNPWAPASTGCDPATDPDCGEVSAWTLASPVVEPVVLGVELRYQPDPLLWLGASVARVWTEIACGAPCGCACEDPGDRTRLRVFLSAGR
jgi:hypothetical protein